MGNSKQNTNDIQLVANAKKFVAAEQLDQKQAKYEESDPRLIEAALEVADTSKNILSGLYFDFRQTGGGSMRRLKNTVLGKIANIVRNTLERSLLSQQKFNEQALFLIKSLQKDNAELRREISALKTMKDSSK
jgi:hypothetical protein